MNTTVEHEYDNSGDKRVPETTVQNIVQSLTTIQSIQNVQSVVQSNIQNIQPTQALVGSVATPTNLVGKSMLMDTNPKLPVMKPVVPSTITSTSETNKITTTICPVGSTVRIISPGMLSTTERQNQPQTQQLLQQAQQQVTTMPATYHLPRGPAAVASIAAPRSTVATPIVRANSGQTVPTRAGINTTISNPQWQPKTTSVVYAQPQRHAVPPVNRISRTSSSVFTSQQPRLITPTGQGRSVQTTMVSGISSTPSRLLTPVLQTSNSITRLPVSQSRLPTPQVSSVSQTTQPGRSTTQTIQPTQPNRPLSSTGVVNRIAVSGPVVGTASRVTASASVSIQPTVGRQLSINTVTSSPTGTVSRIVIPSQQIQQPQQQQQQQQQQQSQSQAAPRVVQTVTSLSNLNTVPRVIATTASTSSTTRIPQPASTTVARITGMSLHSLPLAPVRVTSAPAKTVQAQNIGPTVQIKPSAQQSGFRVSSTNSTNNASTTSAQSVQGQYLHPPHTATYYSFEPTGTYNQYRQTPVRLLVEPGYDEPHTKTNASPRPSILRKRDHDNSPIKGTAKNLVPVLASLPPATTSSPPCSPREDQDGGCQSSGSTTVSATSSPGLDEEPEQSRITINPTLEMSPRKKPRKQQLTGVELTEARCTEEEMQFITEERMKKEFKDESKEKLSEKKQVSNTQCDVKSLTQQTTIAIRSRPTPSLLGPSWKNRWSSRLHHYRRPSEVRPREERRPTVAEIAQQRHVLQKLNGWKVYHLTAQMEDIADLEKQVHEKLKSTLTLLESQQNLKNRQDDGLERVNELIKGNMQRSSLISEGMNEACTQLIAIFEHKGPITDILQRCGNKRAQKKRDK